MIDEQLRECNGLCEYPLYIKGLLMLITNLILILALIKRHQGEIQESLHLFQAAAYLNPNNPSNLKQVGRSLYELFTMYSNLRLGIFWGSTKRH